MNPEALEKAFEIYPDTKVVVIAHLYGTPGKIEELNAVIRKHGAILIEDAAESIPSTLEKAKVRNGQLIQCCKKPQNREAIFDIYKKCGYDGVIQYWRKTEKKDRMILHAKDLVPDSIKRFLKKL